MARKKRDTEPEIADLPAPAERRPNARVFADIAASTKSFRPARETLRRVRAVPTIFPYVDLKTRVGGWPIDRVGLVHGPSNHGKTIFCHGLGLSFLRRHHMYCLVDAEMTTPITWCETLLGSYTDADGFLASRPSSYEETCDDIRRTAEGLADARAKGRVERDTTALFVIDSIRKLVPKNLMARIEKHGADGKDGSVDGYGGRAAQLKAALNAAWLDELVPLMYHTGCAILFVGRESDDVNASARDRQFGNDWKLTGGKALYFDSSVVCRVSLGGKVTIGDEDSKEVVGERHLVEIHKTKVAAKQDRVEKAYFHTSNGRRTPEGFDRARDLLRLGTDLDVFKKSGSWIAFDGRRWQGEVKFCETADPDVLDAIEAACRAKFAEDAAAHADVVGESASGET